MFRASVRCHPPRRKICACCSRSARPRSISSAHWSLRAIRSPARLIVRCASVSPRATPPPGPRSFCRCPACGEGIHRASAACNLQQTALPGEVRLQVVLARSREEPGLYQFATVTETETVASRLPLLLNPFAAMVCAPLETVLEFQLKVPGGVEAK